MKITNMIVSSNKNRFYGTNRRLYITIHETDNTTPTATALNHGVLLQRGTFPSTWHYTVDDKNIVKHFDESVQCWHSGDGKGTGNLHSIGIEMCVNGGTNAYKETVKKTIELVRYLMKKYDIKSSNVVQHNRWSGKNCPRRLRSGSHGVTWSKFKKDIQTSPSGSSEVVSGIHAIPIDKLVNDTMLGRYGNGTERKKKLGSRYDEVQKIINSKYK